MPKKRRNGLFDFLKPRTTVYHVRPKRSAKSKSASHLSASIRKFGPSHKIVRVGDHYEVPSLDRGSWFDSREEAQRFIRELRKYNPMAKHTYSIGSQDFSTLAAARKKAKQYADEDGSPVTITHLIHKQDKHTKTRGRVLGFSAADIKYGADIIVQPKKRNPRRKRNLEVGIPKNQFVNAKVRVKGGKVQILADQSVLGKAGFKGSAGLSGVSVSGGAKLNPKGRYARAYERSYKRALAADDAYQKALDKAKEYRYSTHKSRAARTAKARKVKADAAMKKALDKMRAHGESLN